MAGTGASGRSAYDSWNGTGEADAEGLGDRLERLALLERDDAGMGGQGAAMGLLEWTERYRQLGDEPFRPSTWPWLRDLYQLGTTVPEAWVMKSAQVSISEWLISTALWAADQRIGRRGNALYIFPTQVTMDDFTQGRIDKAIRDSDYLTARVGQTNALGRASVARVRLKEVGAGHLYCRGSDNSIQLKTVDADLVLFDEIDEFKDNVLAYVDKRLASSLIWNGPKQGLKRGGSTPSHPAAGVAAIWDKTTQRRYFLRCDACGERQYLRFPENVTTAGVLVCHACGAALDRTGEGEWVAGRPGADVEGYHVWRAYSPRTNLATLAQLGYQILNKQIASPSTIQQFYNQELGVPYAVAGSQLTDEVLLACVREYGHPATTRHGPVVMGVDVGAQLHVTIWGPSEDEVEQEGACRLLYAGTTDRWEELDALWARFGVHLGVIDGNPEGEKARKWCAAHRGRAYRCYYPNMGDWKHADRAVWNTDQWIVQAHRTQSLDALVERFYQQRCLLPREAPYREFLPGFFDHLKASARVQGKDAEGRVVYRYDEHGQDDHYFHAANYAMLAWHHAAPRWNQKGLSAGSYAYTAGQTPDVPDGAQGAAVVSRRKESLFNEPGVDPFAPRREQETQDREARRIALALERRIRLQQHLQAANGGDPTAPGALRPHWEAEVPADPAEEAQAA